MKFAIRTNCLDYLNYFKSIPTFSLLPEFYQNRIISFFLEERHYMVDPIDVKWFLDGGKRFSIFKTFEELVKLNRVNKIKKVLGCKRHFTSYARLYDWLEKLTTVIKSDEIWVLTHSMGFEYDKPEEWYIVYY